MPRNKLGPVKCSARARTTGERCTQWAMHGGTVCRMHGGEAPQVKAKADERIKALVFPALARLEQLIGDVERNKAGAESEAVALAAARDILDRAGYSATQKVRMEAEIVVETETDRAIREDLRALAQDPGALAGLAGSAEGDCPAESPAS